MFAEIENGYDGKPSIFDNIKQSDVILAFFPCIRFENQIMLAFRGQSHGMEKWTYKDKMIHCMKLLDELNHYYKVVNKMFIICIDRGLKLIVENPYSEEHFLRRYWCLLPAIIDRDRRRNGDYVKKPTQYWFVNCEPQNNILFEQMEYTEPHLIEWMSKENANKMGAKTNKQARSMIHPQYANRFIRQFILKGDEA